MGGGVILELQEVFNFFFWNFSLELHLGVLNSKLEHMEKPVLGVRRFLEKDL